MLHHDGLPPIELATARVTARPALGKGFAAQMPVDGTPTDAEARADPVSRPTLAMECPHPLVLSLAPLVARASQEPDPFLRLGGRENKIAVLAHDLTAGLIDRAKGFGVDGEHHFQHLGEVVQQMEAVGELHRLRRAGPRTLAIDAGGGACGPRVPQL